MLNVPQAGFSIGNDQRDQFEVDAGRTGRWRKAGLMNIELEIW